VGLSWTGFELDWVREGLMAVQFRAARATRWWRSIPKSEELRVAEATLVPGETSGSCGVARRPAQSGSGRSGW